MCSATKQMKCRDEEDEENYRVRYILYPVALCHGHCASPHQGAPLLRVRVPFTHSGGCFVPSSSFRLRQPPDRDQIVGRASAQASAGWSVASDEIEGASL